jgi:hypothetical protein
MDLAATPALTELRDLKAQLELQVTTGSTA